MEISQSSSFVSTDSTGSVKEVKICQVCGDVAKSFHFGGLSCESCKAFFRRSMHNDSHRFFRCSSGLMNCEIRKDNRRLCQHCRLQKCYSIGMDRSWLRSEEDLLRMKKARLAKVKDTRSTSPSSVDYAPDINDMAILLTNDEIAEIEMIVNLYWRACQTVNFDAEVVENTRPRTGLQVISMFTTGIRRWATFCKSLPSFRYLDVQDQVSMLKAAMMQLSLLRAVISFNSTTSEWRENVPADSCSPVLSLTDAERLTPPHMVELVVKFIGSIKKLNPDEAVIMLLALIILFSNERVQLRAAEEVARCQDHYISVLARYCDWKYGPVEGKRTFARFLGLMSDLREISDVHSDHRVYLAHPEMVSIHEQVESLPPSHSSFNGHLKAPHVSEESSVHKRRVHSPR